MDIEQAEKRIKILLADKCNCSECLKNKEAMQTVLNILKEKDEEIDLMAEHIQNGCDFDNRIKTKEEIKQYFKSKETNDG